MAGSESCAGRGNGTGDGFRASVGMGMCIGRYAVERSAAAKCESFHMAAMSA